MAVVKVNFIRNRKGRNMRTIAKGTLDYIESRPGQNHEEMVRRLFSWGGELTQEQAMRIIDYAPKGTRFWRIIISPDPTTEDVKKDLKLSAITKMVMGYLETKFNRDIEFVAAEHNDHTENKHIHAVALLRWKERIYVPELMALIQTATEAALTQRYALDQSFIFLRELQQLVHKEQQRSLVSPSAFSRPVGMAGGRAKQRVRGTRRVPLPTMACATGGINHRVVKLRSGKYWCKTCRKIQERKPTKIVKREQGLSY